MTPAAALTRAADRRARWSASATGRAGCGPATTPTSWLSRATLYRPRRSAAARRRVRRGTPGGNGGPVMMGRFLAALGRALAADNAWLWAYGYVPIAPQYWPRADALDRQVYANAWMTSVRTPSAATAALPGSTGWSTSPRPPSSSRATATGSTWSSSSATRSGSGAGSSRWAPRPTAPSSTRPSSPPASCRRRRAWSRAGWSSSATRQRPWHVRRREHVFLATDLTRARPCGSTRSETCARSFTTAELKRMIREGAIVDAQTLAAYLLLKLRQEGPGQLRPELSRALLDRRTRRYGVDAEAGAVDGDHGADVHAAAAGGAAAARGRAHLPAARPAWACRRGSGRCRASAGISGTTGTPAP